jgi:hypothetical protein
MSVAMKTSELKRVAKHQPFRPFKVRLSNGARYFFKEERDFGAPKDFHTIVFFGQRDIVLIDAEKIVEVFPK